MQKIPPESRPAFDLRGSAIQGISHHRVSDAREVHTNLMGSSRSDTHFEQRELLEAAKHAIFGPCRPAFGKPGRHAHAAHRVSRDRFFDEAAILFDRAMNERKVHLFYLPSGKLCGEALMRRIV